MRTGEFERSRAEDLRHAFDRAFAEAPRDATDDREQLLALRVGAATYAIRLGEITAIHADRTITHLPSPAPALLGLTAIRSTLVPVYDLAALLGVSAIETPRWLVVTTRAVAFAFEAFEGHLRVPKAAVASSESSTSSHAREVVTTGRGAIPLLRLSSVVDGLAQNPSR